MTTVIVVAIGIFGYQLARRAKTFKAALTVLLVVLVLMGLVIASDI